MTCPVCTGDSLKPALQIKGYDLLDCARCGHRFAEVKVDASHVTTVYGDDYFLGGGAGYANYLAEGEMLREQGRAYHDLLVPFVGKGAHLLDVGAAGGLVMKGLLGDAWTGQGVEPNATMAAHARDDLGLDVTKTALEDFSSSAKFDVVTCIQVMPHFYDVQRAMEAIAQVTRTTSHLLVETWNKDSKTARLLGKHWHEYSPPSVLHWFSPSTLDTLVRRFGFERITQGKPKKELSSGQAKALVDHKLSGTGLASPFRKLALAVPDSWSVPYPADDIFYCLYRRM